MAVLSHPDSQAQWREAARLLRTGIGWILFTVGWLLAKTLRGIATAIAATLFGVGYVAARVVWPALRWSGRAVKLGWEQGRKPGLRVG